MKLALLAKSPVATDTVRLRLAAADGGLAPSFDPGAHIELTLGNGLTRRYSLTSPPDRRDFYEITVLRVRPSRGGSAYIHEQFQPNETVEAQGPFNAFPLVIDAPYSVFIAGGIGITPFLTMTAALDSAGNPYEVHYAARSADRLVALACDGIVKRYIDRDAEPTLDVGRVLRRAPAKAHIYVCGPRGLIDAVRQTASAQGYPPESVHFESFGPVRLEGDQPIRVNLARSGISLEVPPSMTILEVLLANGVWAPYECRRGECASCVTGVLAGMPDHRDVCLTEEQRRSAICTCVSRARTAKLTLDL